MDTRNMKDVVKMNFNQFLAKEIGVEEAIMYSNLEFWVTQNEANESKIAFKDGEYWTYNSVNAFNKLFFFWTPRQIQRILKNLEDKGYIESKNYNKAKYDRTKWYRCVSKKVEMTISACKNDFSQTRKSISPNGEMEYTERCNGVHQTGEPIPDYKQQIINPDSFADAETTPEISLAGETAKESNSSNLSEKLLNKDVQEILDILYVANSTIPEPAFFGRKVFRDAIKQLIEKVGSTNAINAAKLAILVRNKKFAPSATTPLELRDKYHKLEEYLNKEKDNIGEMMGLEPSLDIPEGVNPFSNTADNGDFDYNAWAASQNKKGGKIFFGTDFSKK